MEATNELEKLEILFESNERIKPEELDWLIDCYRHNLVKEGKSGEKDVLRYVFLKGYNFDKL